MGYQDDYVMRTISDLVRAIARLALGKTRSIMPFRIQRINTAIQTVFTGNCVIW